MVRLTMASVSGNFGYMCKENNFVPPPLPGVACENNAISHFQDFFRPPPPMLFSFVYQINQAVGQTSPDLKSKTTRKAVLHAEVVRIENAPFLRVLFAIPVTHREAHNVLVQVLTKGHCLPVPKVERKSL